MSIIYIALAVIATLLDATTTRVRGLRSADRGSVSVEQVIITGAVLVLAIAVVGAITLAVNGRLGDIV